MHFFNGDQTEEALTKLKTRLERLPEQDRLPDLRVMFKEEGKTTLYTMGHIDRTLQVLLKLFPADQRMVVLRITDEKGHSLLHKAARNLQALKIILGLLPENQRLHFLRTPIVKQNSILDYLVSYGVIISSADEGFQDSFVPDFMKISPFLANKAEEQAYAHHRALGGTMDAVHLMSLINQCHSFDEIKMQFIHYVSEHLKNPLSQQLFNVFGATKGIDELKQRWGINEHVTELRVTV